MSESARKFLARFAETQAEPAAAPEFDRDDGTGGDAAEPATRAVARKRRMQEIRRYAKEPDISEWMAIAEQTRPRSRGDCGNRRRPCPYVSCRHHLYLDVNPETGSIKLNFPDKEVWELEETCSLDVAERGGITLEDVGNIMSLTRERIRQIEITSLASMRRVGGSLDD